MLRQIKNVNLSIITRSCLLIIISILSIACSNTSPNIANDDAPQSSDPIFMIAQLNEQHYQWKNTPYRIGGNSRSGIDCSAFVMTTFKDKFAINLPRTTKEQAKHGILINKKQIQTGDLVFFKTNRGPYGYHVGIYVKDGLFLHASTKEGVIYSALNNPYWQKTFWQARRV